MNLTPLPAGPIDVVTWYRYDIELRQTDAQQRQDNYLADAANLADYRVKQLAAMKANTDALASGLDGDASSESHLVRAFMQEMAGDWAMTSRGQNDMLAKAKLLAQAFRAAYPLP